MASIFCNKGRSYFIGNVGKINFIHFKVIWAFGRGAPEDLRPWRQAFKLFQLVLTQWWLISSRNHFVLKSYLVPNTMLRIMGVWKSISWLFIAVLVTLWSSVLANQIHEQTREIIKVLAWRDLNIFLIGINVLVWCIQVSLSHISNQKRVCPVPGEGSAGKPSAQDLSLDPRNQVKLWGIVAHACNLTAGKGWGWGSLEFVAQPV